MRQIIFFLHWAKENTKNVYNNIMNSIKQFYNNISYKTKWILYLWILKIVKHSVPIDYYSIFHIR